MKTSIILILIFVLIIAIPNCHADFKALKYSIKNPKEILISDQLIYNDSIIKGSISISNASIARTVVFNNVLLRDEVNFQNSNFSKEVSFSNVTFEKSVLFNNTHFNDNVSFKNVNFIGGAYFNTLTLTNWGIH
jgi:uncharacterized protein YjbI with pentapeptide repeats